MLLTFFNNTQQQHNDMPQNVDIVGQQYIAINIVCRYMNQNPHVEKKIAWLHLAAIANYNFSILFEHL